MPDARTKRNMRGVVATPLDKVSNLHILVGDPLNRDFTSACFGIHSCLGHKVDRSEAHWGTFLTINLALNMDLKPIGISFFRSCLAIATRFS